MMRRLKKRAQFLNAARGRRTKVRGIALQAVKSNLEEPGVGFTVTKKTGNSVERNRIKRRLRAAAGACTTTFQSQHDYVLIGRREALSLPFPKLVSSIQSMIASVHANRQSTNRT